MATLNVEALKKQGFSEDEINSYVQELRADAETKRAATDSKKINTLNKLKEAGFSAGEIDDYFGAPKPPTEEAVKNVINQNLQKRNEQGNQQVESQRQAPRDEAATPFTKDSEVADSFLDALEAGFDISVSGLSMDRPDMMLDENASLYYKIASQVGTIAGDLPAMIAGGVAGGVAGGSLGGAVGSAIPVAGTVAGAAGGALLGAGAGSNALPEGLRGAMMEYYERGEVDSFEDFWAIASRSMIEAAKGGALGAVTFGAGKVVGRAARGLSAGAQTTARLGTEVGVMTTLGSALQGEVPEPGDFLEAAVLVGGLTGGVKAGTYASKRIASKMRGIYSQSGITPTEVAMEATKNPKLRQMLAANNTPPEAIVQALMKDRINLKPITEIPKEIKLSEPLNMAKEARQKVQGESQYSPEVDNILSKIGDRQGKIKEPLSGGAVKAKVKQSADQVYTDYVDRLHPINEAVKTIAENPKEILADKNPYILSRQVPDAKAKAKYFFEKGTLDYNTLKDNGKSFKNILNQAEDINVLEAYMVSKRAIDLEAKGIKSGFDINAARATVRNNKKKYEKIANEVTEFSNRSLQYAKDSGIISDASYKQMLEANKNYVPFKRLFELADGEVRTKGGKAGSLKQLKGSEREIQRPITSILENTQELIQMAEINRAKRSLIDLAESNPERSAGLFERVNRPAQKLVIPKGEVANLMKKQGLDPSAAENLVTYRRLQKELAPNEFSVYRQGKLEIYKTDNVSLAESIKTLGGDSGSTNMAFRLARGLTFIKKVGITFTPDFVLRNLIRDKTTASIFSESGGIKITDIASAMGDMIKKNDVYYNWLKSGGSNGAFLEMGQRYIEKDIIGLQKQTNFMASAKNVVMKPVDLMRIGQDLTEQSLRIAEFKKVTKGQTDKTALAKGGMASREITVDFQRMGAKMSALNSITAFMNVSVQGLDRTARAFKGDPKATATKAFTYVTAPSILLWWATKDDERVKEIPRWEKDMFWIIPTDSWEEASPDMAATMPNHLVRKRGDKYEVNNGVVYRIPKPMELGVIFGSIPERVLESFFNDNPKAFKDFDETMLQTVTPAFVPDAIAPIAEQYMNRSFFTGNDLVPYHMEKVKNEYQFTEYTSDTAKTLAGLVPDYIGDATELNSPMVLDNYIRSWGGTLGQYAVDTMDKVLQKAGVTEDIEEASPTLKDIPFVKAFVTRYPSAGAASIQDFYDNYDKFVEYRATISQLKRTGNLEALQKEIEDPENRIRMVDLSKMSRAISAQSKMIKGINKMPDLTPDEKRQMIDMYYFNMIEVAKAGNQMIEDLEKKIKEDEESGE